MSELLWNLASFIIALGILVAVHEYGHFWVARRCGVIVEKFSIGFGKSIWSRKGKDGTEYSISMIPLGGYVKMLDERVDDVPEELKKHAFNNRPLWQRSAIVAAGPIANFIFAVFACWLAFMIGVTALKPVVGSVENNSIFSQAGIESGVELKAISGIKTSDWESVNMAIVSHIGDESMTVTYSDSDNIGVDVTKRLDLSSWKFDPEKDSPMLTLGFRPYRPEVTLTIANVSDNSAASRSGMLIGDILSSVNGKELSKWQQMVDEIQGNPSAPMSIVVIRDGIDTTLTLTPDSREDSEGKLIGFAGVSPEFKGWPEGYRYEKQYGPIVALEKAMIKTGNIIDLTLTMTKKLFTGDVALNNLSGPISIAKGAGATADYGIVSFLGFLALISVNLGIINLLPLPVLDGGHLLFFAIEGITRKPVPERVQEIGYKVGTALIMSLMAVALFNDFMRL
ncbi:MULTISPECIES: sigma E protease regulator RseP [Aliivibrio]|jgi:regulator of sigma E protease|uniref:Zinc metalloprotease n=2 Tax=Aliivibrio TaxID=511678 RepID=A0A1B9NXR8_ALILO|nr:MULTISPECIES: sigma E protease regulator RseP [Aliivibrio]AZL85515.1 sigma E protease regulator RseP [Aliivibrio salmonicida]OCH20527.1 RIP metalloprotease RseP [Aliivibrio logei]CAQ80104.1 protease EcfE [Aliivibrio salmonicida LFI1238]